MRKFLIDFFLRFDLEQLLAIAHKLFCQRCRLRKTDVLLSVLDHRKQNLLIVQLVNLFVVIDNLVIYLLASLLLLIFLMNHSVDFCGSYSTLLIRLRRSNL